MERTSPLARLGRVVSCAALAFGMSNALAASTSLEFTGLMLDGDGNRINSPFVIFTHGIYNSPTGGTLLGTLGTEYVHVGNGSFVQVFGVDDSLFESSAYLQVNLNGSELAPRLGIFFNDSYFFVSGETSGGPPGTTFFQIYAGLSAPPPIPEPETYGLMLGGLAFIAGFAARRRSASRGAQGAD